VWPFCQRKGFASGVIAAPSVGLRPGNGGDVGPLTRQLQGRAGDLHGRIVACGGISMYNDQKPRRGFSTLPRTPAPLSRGTTLRRSSIGRRIATPLLTTVVRHRFPGVVGSIFDAL